MTEEEDIDARIGAALRGSNRDPDPVFLARVERALLAERRMEAQRRSAWRRFAAEAAATIAVAVAFVVIARAGPAPGDLERIAASPASAATVLLLIWLVVAFRPAPATGR